MANTFLAPPPRGVAALVSVSDDKIQITILRLRRGALSRWGHRLPVKALALSARGLDNLDDLRCTKLHYDKKQKNTEKTKKKGRKKRKLKKIKKKRKKKNKKGKKGILEKL